jgi:hypothetical protein
MIAEAIVLGIILGLSAAFRGFSSSGLGQRWGELSPEALRKINARVKYRANVDTGAGEFNRPLHRVFEIPRNVLDDVELNHMEKIRRLEKLYEPSRYDGAFIGFFRQWMYMNGMMNKEAENEMIQRLKSRKLKSDESFFEFNSNQIDLNDFTKEGKYFAESSYWYYLKVFEVEFSDFESVYFVRNNLENYSRIKKFLNKKYPIWKFSDYLKK